ncbi:hypothetical protein GF326_02185 [Candidatus Bathyarchaeota archaeon]|nr:hypothetical protein [Candidatus Bathyarchaeota archaeon]
MKERVEAGIYVSFFGYQDRVKRSSYQLRRLLKAEYSYMISLESEFTVAEETDKKSLSPTIYIIT